ncbi:MAG: hypothetical protein ACOC22_03875 [bacterium]
MLEFNTESIEYRLKPNCNCNSTYTTSGGIVKCLDCGVQWVRRTGEEKLKDWIKQYRELEKENRYLLEKLEKANIYLMEQIKEKSEKVRHNHRKYIPVKEFREKGYLQEVNRRFLHPLGLALEVYIDENGEEEITGVWDSREDPEGIYYDLKNSDQERLERFQKNKEFVNNEFEKRASERSKLFGSVIEPIVYYPKGEIVTFEYNFDPKISKESIATEINSFNNRKENLVGGLVYEEKDALVVDSKHKTHEILGIYLVDSHRILLKVRIFTNTKIGKLIMEKNLSEIIFKPSMVLEEKDNGEFELLKILSFNIHVDENILAMV